MPSVANADSALYGYISTQGVPDYGTQANRGIHYGLDMESFVTAQGTNGDNYLSVSTGGSIPTATSVEKTNWGLVSDRDNAYNGIEDVNYQVRDNGGYLTVPEDRTYGDFITPVTTTNTNILKQLIYRVAALTQGSASFTRSDARDRCHAPFFSTQPSSTSLICLIPVGRRDLNAIGYCPDAAATPSLWPRPGLLGDEAISCERWQDWRSG